MTTSTIEATVRNVWGIDENAHLERGDPLSRGREWEEGTIIETVITATYEEGRLARFRTIRRVGDDIIESGFVLDRAMGRLNFLGSGIYYKEDHVVYDPKDSKIALFITHTSEKYWELNELLEKFGR